MGGVAVGAVRVRLMLHLRVILGFWLTGVGTEAVGWRRFIRVAGGDAALIEGPAWASGFILVYAVKGSGC